MTPGGQKTTVPGPLQSGGLSRHVRAGAIRPERPRSHLARPQFHKYRNGPDQPLRTGSGNKSMSIRSSAHAGRESLHSRAVIVTIPIRAASVAWRRPCCDSIRAGAAREEVENASRVKMKRRSSITRLRSLQELPGPDSIGRRRSIFHDWRQVPFFRGRIQLCSGRRAFRPRAAGRANRRYPLLRRRGHGHQRP